MRLGLVGAGNMGRTHASYYAQMDEVEIAGVVGRGARRAAALARTLKVRALGSVQELLRDDSVDAVDICTPGSTHRALAVAALKAGKHVFCETPMALTVADGEFMLRAASDARRHLLIAQVMRFVSANKVLRDAVISGKYGKPLSVYAARLTAPYWTGTGQRHFQDFGEPVVDLMIHDFDYVSWLLGHIPTTVTGTGTMGKSGAFEHAYVSLHYRGVHALAEGGAMMPSSWPFTTVHRIECEKGAFEVTFRLHAKGPRTDFIMYPARGHPVSPAYVDVDPYRDECLHFVRCVQGKEKPQPLDPESALDALRIALAAGQALKSDKPLIMTPHPGRRGIVPPYLPSVPRRPRGRRGRS